MSGGCCSSCGLCCSRFKLIVSILLSAWNNLATIINAVNLYHSGYSTFAFLMISFLFFPGLVSSMVFVVQQIKAQRHKQQQQQDDQLVEEQQQVGLGRPPLRVILIALALFLAFPVVPFVLALHALVTDARVERFSLARLLETFLDDGPQFVLKVMLVVLYGLDLKGDDAAVPDSFGYIEETILYSSLLTSLLSLVWSGLSFNERAVNWMTKLVVAAPMLLAFALARAFTMAVVIKETLFKKQLEDLIQSRDLLSPIWWSGLLLLLSFTLLNSLLFRYCGQDWSRSVMLGLCSFLVPAGYNNDEQYFQCPHQPLIEDPIEPLDEEIGYNKDKDDNVDNNEKHEDNEKHDDNDNDDDKGSNIEVDVEPSRCCSRPKRFWPSGLGWMTRLRLKRFSRNRNTNNNVDQDNDNNRGYGKMRSRCFLTLYTITNCCLLAASASLLLATELGEDANNALLLPQMVSFVPGTLFASARILLMSGSGDDGSCLGHCCRSTWRHTIAALIVALAFISSGAALFTSVSVELFSSVFDRK